MNVITTTSRFKRQMMQRIITGAVLVLTLTGLAACAPKEEAQTKEPRFVEVIRVASAQIAKSVSTTGAISARVQTDLSFRVSGRIIERRVDVGDHVKAGQILARIDAEEQRADMEVAQASLQSAEAQLMQAQQAFDRQQNLFSTGVTTRAALDSAQEALLSGKAVVQSAQAQVDTAKDALRQTDLLADSDGIIVARNAEVGQVAQTAQTVFTLAHDGPRDAIVKADESVLLGGELEQDVEVRMLAGGEPIAAAVREVSPTIDTSTGTIRVKLGLTDAPDIRLGSTVIVTARFKPEPTIELPWSAMASDKGKSAVWIVDPKTNAVSVRPVEVATYASGHFDVVSGVSDGDIVVAGGTQFLGAGQVVTFEGAAK
jgi:membrane fusion protein, multidrug efflux system